MANSPVYFGTKKLSDVGMSTGYSADGDSAVLQVRCEIKKATNKLFRDEVENLVKNYLKPSGVQEVKIPRTVGIRQYVDSIKYQVKIAGRSYGIMACDSVNIAEEYANGFGVIEITFRGSI